MPEEKELQIAALRHNACDAAHTYARHVGEPLLIEAWPKPVWMANADTALGVEVPAGETTEQRRARWLDWYGEGEHGALQRVYERELPLNPGADRSYIGKQIRVAKRERDDKKQGGAMFGQLMQDGKRKG
jgi:hypothetical protein